MWQSTLSIPESVSGGLQIFESACPDRYQYDLAGRELKSGTIRVRVATLGSFGKWMVRRDKLVRNPVDRLTRPRRRLGDLMDETLKAIITYVVTFVGGYLSRYIEPRARLVHWFPGWVTFALPLPAPAAGTTNVSTHTLTVQNVAGGLLRRPASQSGRLCHRAGAQGAAIAG